MNGGGTRMLDPPNNSHNEQMELQQNGAQQQQFHSISLRSAVNKPIVLSFVGPSNGSIGVGPAAGDSKCELIGVTTRADPSRHKWFGCCCPSAACSPLSRLLRSRRFLRIMVALLSVLALLLIISLVWMIVISNEQRQQLEEDAEFLNKDSSWRSNGCQRKCNANFDVPPLLLISMDGFRADYLLRNKSHAVSRILQCGSSAQYMLPSYPSKTFPNHFTIVTGLYPESHGIVDNNFFDEQMQMKFSKASRDAAWYNGEPIWNTVMKNGKKTAIFFWPGSEVPIQGMLPSYHYDYDPTMPFSKRVDQVIEWLRLDDTERPAFLAMYFEQPDTAAHNEGPDSDAVNSAIIYVDAMINYLLQQLDDNGFLGCINLVILSDHGGQKLREDHFVALDEFVDANDPNVNGVFGGTVGHINFRNTASPIFIDDVLTKMSCTGGQTFRVYGRESMPIRYHYTRNARIGEIVVDSVGGAKLFVDKQSLREYGPKEKGDHGYDNRMREMRALFGAWGPSIKQSYEEKPFQNIELYNLFTTLMQLPVSAPNNGTLGRLHSLLRSPPPLEERPMVELAECEGVRLIKCGDGCHFELNYQIPQNVVSAPAGQEQVEQQQQQQTSSNSAAAAAKIPVYNSQRCKYAERIRVSASLHRQGQLCLIRMCNATMVFNRRFGMANYVESQLSSPIPNIDHRANCSAHLVVPMTSGATNIPEGGGEEATATTNRRQQLPVAANDNLIANLQGGGKMERSAADNDANNLSETNDPVEGNGNSPPPWDRPSEAANAITRTTTEEQSNATSMTTPMGTAAAMPPQQPNGQQQQMNAHRQECAQLMGERVDLLAGNNNNNGQQPAWISLFPDNHYARYIAQGQFRVPMGFYNGPWKQLLSLIRQYVQHYKQLRMWTGPVFDHDYNGIADPNIFSQSAEMDTQQQHQQQTPPTTLPPSHIFLILMRCSNNSWHSSGQRCEQPDRVKTLAFVLPMLEKDLNCLFSVEYIFRHTTTIRDIEQLTGNEWFTDRDVYSPELAIQLRTQLNEQLWQLEVHS